MNTIIFKEQMMPNVFLFERITERKDGSVLVTSGFRSSNRKKILYIKEKELSYMHKRILGMKKVK